MLVSPSAVLHSKVILWNLISSTDNSTPYSSLTYCKILSCVSYSEFHYRDRWITSLLLASMMQHRSHLSLPSSAFFLKIYSKLTYVSEVHNTSSPSILCLPSLNLISFRDEAPFSLPVSNTSSSKFYYSKWIMDCEGIILEIWSLRSCIVTASSW